MPIPAAAPVESPEEEDVMSSERLVVWEELLLVSVSVGVDLADVEELLDSSSLSMDVGRVVVDVVVVVVVVFFRVMLKNSVPVWPPVSPSMNKMILKTSESFRSLVVATIHGCRVIPTVPCVMYSKSPIDPPSVVLC